MTIYRFRLLLAAGGLPFALPAHSATVAYDNYHPALSGLYSEEYRQCSKPEALKADLKEMICFEGEFKRARTEAQRAWKDDAEAFRRWEARRDHDCNDQVKKITGQLAVYRTFSRCLIDETLRQVAWLREKEGK